MLMSLQLMQLWMVPSNTMSSSVRVSSVQLFWQCMNSSFVMVELHDFPFSANVQPQVSLLKASALEGSGIFASAKSNAKSLLSLKVSLSLSSSIENSFSDTSSPLIFLMFELFFACYKLCIYMY